MKITNTLTLRHLKSNLKRTIVTVMGIIVSVAMITAVCVSVSSFLDFLEASEIDTSGYYHAAINEDYTDDELTADKLEKIADSKGVKYAGAVNLDPLEQANVHNSEFENKGIAEIGTMNADAFKIFAKDYDGEIPKNEKEIVVSKEFIKKNQLDWKIGQTVNLDIETVIDDKFTATNREYTIVGMMGENKPTDGHKFDFPIIRGFANDETQYNNIYIQMDKTSSNSAKQAGVAIDEAGIKFEKSMLNPSIYISHFVAVNGNMDMLGSFLTAATIILLIIIVASVMLIYNSFGISLAERSRYLGMLATVGATKKQKRETVLFEGLVLGVASIPFGIFFGIIGIDITLRLLSPHIINTGFTEMYDYTMHAVVHWPIIVAIVLLSAFTIAISSFIPAIKASKTTPIDALRQSNEVKVKAKKLKTPKIVNKIFGYEGELALKNIKRNGKKSRIISVSLAISIILFISTNTFCTLFQQAMNTQMILPYQVEINYYGEGEKQDIEQIRKTVNAIDKVDNSYSITSMYNCAQMNKDLFNDKFLQIIPPDSSEYTSKTNMNYAIYFLDDKDFIQLCKENSIDSTPYFENNGARKALVKNEMVVSNKNKKTVTKPFKDDAVGKTVIEKDVENEDYIEYKNDIVIGDFITKSSGYVEKLNVSSVLNMYMPYSAVADLGLKAFSLGVETKDPDFVEEKLLEIYDQYNGMRIINIKGQMQLMNSMIIVVKTFSYGFITLMTLVAVANIFNTISTSFELRKKEFAMMKSIGITPKGFNKMICLESIFYGLKAILIGIPVSMIINAFMYLALSESISLLNMFDWKIYLITVAAVFIIIGLAMLYSWSKAKHDTIIDTLKTEIN